MPYKDKAKQRAYQKEWDANLSEEKKAEKLRKAREYKRRNKEKLKAKNKKYREENKERIKETRRKADAKWRANGGQELKNEYRRKQRENPEYKQHERLKKFEYKYGEYGEVALALCEFNRVLREKKYR